MNVVLLGANNPKLVGEVVGNLVAAGNTVTVEREFVPCIGLECSKCGGGTLLARIEYKKPVNEEERDNLGHNCSRADYFRTRGFARYRCREKTPVRDWWTPYGEERWEEGEADADADKVMDELLRDFRKIRYGLSLERKCFLTAADLVWLKSLKISLVPADPPNFGFLEKSEIVHRGGELDA